jgi:hypothetical protein
VNHSLCRLLPTMVLGLLIGANCRGPDEVRRVNSAPVGGSTSSSAGQSGTGGAGVSGSAGSTQPTGGSINPTSSGGSGGKSSAGGTTSATGGKGGSGGIGGGGRSSSTGGVSTGGTTSSYPPIGGGGTIASGGTTDVSTGGAGGNGGSTASTSVTPPPSGGLGVYVKGITAGKGLITLDLRIDNKTDKPVDMSTVTLRYWYQEEALGTALTVASDYVSIGYSTLGKVVDGKAVASSSGPGADHYLDLSFSGTLAAQGDKNTNDLFNIKVTLHNSSWSGTVDVTNDYSYSSGATGYDEKITLHDSTGKVIWGKAPSGGGAPTPVDAGVDVRAGRGDSGG